MATASLNPRTGALVAAGYHRLLRIPRSANQHLGTRHVPFLDHRSLAALAKTASQKDRTTWQRITKLADDFLPRARIRHPWPEERFAVKHPRWEPSARIGHARFCAGGA